MGDRPTKVELLQAVRRFLDEELLPDLDGVRRFHARVAVNALAIVEREIELEADSLPRLHSELSALLESDAPVPADLDGLRTSLDEMEGRLCERIRAGEADAAPFRDRVMAYLRCSVRERLAVSNPTYR